MFIAFGYMSFNCSNVISFSRVGFTYSQQKAELLDRSSSHIADSKRKMAHRLQIAVFQNIV